MMRLLKPAFIFGLALLLTGCLWDVIPNTPKNTETFQPAKKSEKIDFLDKDALAAFEDEAEPVYRLGEGDHINLQVWNRPELSGKHVVGPDGLITVPLVGPMRINTMTRDEAAGTISMALKPYYTYPSVTLGIEEYQSNRITVLGRVLTPGVLKFERPPELLEALARAGSLPVLDKQATLTRCAIFRGRDRVIWVDLKHLLNRGDLSYNIRLKPNDLIYIPDSSDTMVYVMGQVGKPGAYRLTPDMSLMDAIAQAGGPTEDANDEAISLYRPGQEATQLAPLKSLLTADRKVNYALEEGDVIYIPKKGIAEVGYVLRQLLPGLSIIQLGMALKN
jgi:polysaccharide biosynthesis/export protein